MSENDKRQEAPKVKKVNPIPNSKPWPKGVSGNPAGRPKKIPNLDMLLADILSEDIKGEEAAKAILKKLRSNALKGNVKATEVLLDRAYGKAKQIIGGDAAAPIKVQIEIPKELDITVSDTE